jgi:hypothetical protein
VPKYLILDKSILHGTSTADLREFVQAHSVIFPETLFYECVTTAREEKDAMLARCREVFLAGAHFCPTLSSIVHAEARELRPYGHPVNREHTAAVKQTLQSNVRPYDLYGVETKWQNEQAFVDHVRTNISRITDLAEADHPETLQDEIKRWGDDIDGSRLERLQDRVSFLDSKDLHEAANTLLSGMTSKPTEFCLSGDWISWHFVRVALLWLLEREFCHQVRRRMKRRDLEHDTCDMEYVTFLSRTDGLLMHDLLWQDIAKAAFREKDVFSSLEEVPESYRCDWAAA